MSLRRDPLTPTPPEAVESKETRKDREAALKDVDRLMMQIVQTSLSLIGFGFTINAFFNSSDRGGALAARRLGLGMLCLGLLFLGISIWNQTKYRLALSRRFQHLPRTPDAAPYNATASLLVAWCLLLIGLFGFGSIVLSRAY